MEVPAVRVGELNNMVTKRYWQDSIQYKRILEILDDYWLTQSDEDFVEVNFFFKRGNESQFKTIIWQNPNNKQKGEVHGESSILNGLYQ